MAFLNGTYNRNYLSITVLVCVIISFRSLCFSSKHKVRLFLFPNFVLYMCIQILKALGMVCAVGAGLFVGSEGPTIQVCIYIYVHT